MPEHNIKVQVHYIAATKPYMAEVTPSQTVGTLKANAMTFFQLVESGNKTYKLFLHKTELTNLQETLGRIADDKHDLNMDLEEFIIQGK